MQINDASTRNLASEIAYGNFYACLWQNDLCSRPGLGLRTNVGRLAVLVSLFQSSCEKRLNQQSLCERRELMGEKTRQKNETVDCHGEKSVVLKTIVNQHRTRAGRDNGGSAGKRSPIRTCINTVYKWYNFCKLMLWSKYFFFVSVRNNSTELESFVAKWDFSQLWQLLNFPHMTPALKILDSTKWKQSQLLEVSCVL